MRGGPITPEILPRKANPAARPAWCRGGQRPPATVTDQEVGKAPVGKGDTLQETLGDDQGTPSSWTSTHGGWGACTDKLLR